MIINFENVSAIVDIVANSISILTAVFAAIRAINAVGRKIRANANRRRNRGSRNRRRNRRVRGPAPPRR